MDKTGGRFTVNRQRPRISIFRCEIDPLTKDEAISTIIGWTRDGAACRYIVTPNVHHLVLLQEQNGLRKAYENADLTLVDGRPVGWALKLMKNPVPEVIPGSDLVPALFDTATPDRLLTVFLLGAAPGVAEKAANAIRARWKCVRVVGVCSPSTSFEEDPAELEGIVRQINEAAPGLVVIGLGCPKQEIWASQFAPRLNAKVAICAGATIDFIAGHRRRAPVWMRKIGCEWLFRALTEPLRLGPRYLQDGIVFPTIIARSLFTRVAFKDAGAADRLLGRAITTPRHPPVYWDAPRGSTRRPWSFGKLW